RDRGSPGHQGPQAPAGTPSRRPGPQRQEPHLQCERPLGPDLESQRRQPLRRRTFMTLMNSLIKTTTPAPPKMIVYGQPGVGKTTFAASAEAVLLDCENGAGAVAGLTRTPYLATWPEMRKWLVEIANQPPEGVSALAIDTIDWMVQRIAEHVVLDLDGKARNDITNTLGT